MTNNPRHRNGSLRSVGRFSCVASALIALSCGGASHSEPLVPAASAGDEPPPTAAGPREPAPVGRGRIVVKATCAGQPVEAQGHMPIERGLVVDFNMGQEFSAEAGTRHIEVTLLDNIILLDKPSLQLDVEVEPNKLTKVDALFPAAKVQLTLLIHGKEQPPTAIKLLRKGEVVATTKSSSPAFLISPGTYEAEVAVKGKATRVKGLVFFEGTDQVVPVRVP